MTTRPFHRPARLGGPERPRGELLLESPPELPESAGGNFGQLMTLLPMLAGGGAMVFMFAGNGGGATSYVVGGLYGMSTFGMMVGSLARGSGDKKRRTDGERRDYLRYLSQVRVRVRDTAERQRAAALWDSPEPSALWSMAMSSRLWERRGADADFGTARVALGPQRLATRLVAPDTKPLEDLDPIGATALRSLIRTHAEVPELPISVSIGGYSRIAVRGEEAATRDLVRALLCQLATFHAPEELRIAVCASRLRAAEWGWVKWLPHARHQTETDQAGALRLIEEDLGDLEELLGTDLSERPRFRPNAIRGTETAQLVVVLDGGRVPQEAQLAVGDAAGVVLIDLSESTARDGDRHLLRLVTGPDTLTMLVRRADGEDDRVALGRPDRLTVDQAEGLARVLAPVRTPQAAVAAQPMAVGLELPALLGMTDVEAFDAEEAWRRRAARDRLRLPIGVGADGVPVELDIKESAQGGVGPHGLIVGATGSGKSELLRTLVIGLAATHSSEALNFVLVDFKGGATFLGLEQLTHTSALITNLSDELPLVARMEDALRGELTRRQELLRAAGNYTSVFDYERARAAGAPLEPLPTLMIVVDEFTELLTTRPEFAELFVMIGRLGRSLAVHLLLASQRLEEGRLRGLETHLSYRICLRTFSAMESRMVLGVPDAYELPGEPGHGYVKSDVSTLIRFKAAYVSGPHTPAVRGVAAAANPGAGAVAPIVPFTAARIPVPPVPAASAPAADPGAAGPDDGRTPGPRALRTFDVLLGRLRGRGRPAHRVWLPPLAEPPTLDALLGPVGVDPDAGLVAASSPLRGTLHAAVGVEDRPFEQRRDPLVVDLSGPSGSVAVVGAPQSGKSTIVRTLICSLALTHTPAEVQFYCLDFGGGTLTALAGLPHVGGVAPRTSAEQVRRTVAEVTAILERREAAFQRAGLDSAAAWRAARRDAAFSGFSGIDDALGSADIGHSGDVFLVVDGWDRLRQEYDTLEAAITVIATRGLAFGVHVVVSAGRWADIRQQMRDSLSSRLELRMGEPFESEMSRQVAADVPADRPGRGVSRDKLHFLGALPRIDGVSRPDDLAAGLRALTEASAAAWKGPRVPQVRLLPREVAPAELVAASAALPGIPLGLGEDDLAPVTLDFTADPHFLVFGESGSGKSSVLRHLTERIAATHDPRDARIAIVDYRRSLLEVIAEPHLIAYAGSPAMAESIVRDLAEVMRTRLPGPDVSPAQLRDRSWWSGSDLYLVVDDADLVGGAAANPLAALADVLPHSRDVGLHLIIARSSAGAARAMMDPVARQLKELAAPGLVLSGSRDDGVLIGQVYGTAQPPGRGVLVRRSRANLLVQTPWRPPAGE